MDARRLGCETDGSILDMQPRQAQDVELSAGAAQAFTTASMCNT